MVTSGRVPKVLPRSVNKAAVPMARRWLPGWTLACAFGLLLLGGCAAPTMQMGKPPAVDRLGQLKPGVSTSKDVIAVLGEPQGRGATRSGSYGLKDAWLYESTEVEGTTARVRMLMIFLDKDTALYHGHMWMASGFLYGQTKE